jgi:hypothetical protein
MARIARRFILIGVVMTAALATAGCRKDIQEAQAPAAVPATGIL